MRPILAALLSSTLIFSGCLEPKGADVADDVPAIDDQAAMAAVRGLLEDVPCEASVSLDATSKNVVRLGEGVETQGYAAEIVLGADDIMAVGREGSNGGFDLFDISDPLAPRLLAEVFSEEGQSTRDLKFSPDNQTLFVATGALSVDIYDVRTLTEPVRTSHFEIPDGDAHMLLTARIEGEDWLFLTPLNNDGIWVYRIIGEPGNVEVEYVTKTDEVQGGPLGPHDMWYTRDEKTGQHLLYAADGFEGWSVWDVADPTTPARIALSPNIDPYQGYVHTIQGAWIEGRRIVATIAEVGHNALKVYDATDFRTPLLLGTWQADPAMDSTSPQHNLQIVDGRLYVAHYTEGVFVFDLRELGDLPAAELAQIEPVAHYRNNATNGFGPVAWDEFWDVVLKDGVLYAGDYWGLHVIGYGCLRPGDELQTSLG